MSFHRALATLVFVTALAPAAAFGQAPQAQPVPSDADKATARELTIEGYKLLEAKDYAGAADRFKRADSMYHAPTITLGLGRAYRGLGQLLDAQEAFSKTAHETVPPNASAAFTNAVSDAQRELADIQPRVPGVVINVKGSDKPRVQMDGADVPAAALGVKRSVNPGKHLIKVRAPGFKPAEATFSVVEGKVESVTVTLEPGPGGDDPVVAEPLGGRPGPGVSPVDGRGPNEPDKPVSPMMKYLGYGGLGLGAAGLVLGGVTGAMALGKHSDLLKLCPDGHCAKGSESKYQSQVDSYNTMGTLSTVGFIAGGVLAATGVVLLVTAPKAKPAKTAVVTPFIGPGFVGAGAEGKF